jgi:hypothetical protein
LEDHILSSSFDTASLTSIELGENFHAISGIFHERFAQYLHNHSDIEYVEKNQIFKAVRAVPQAQLHKLIERSLEQYKAPSWGLARVFHRDNSGLDTYSADSNSG